MSRIFVFEVPDALDEETRLHGSIDIRDDEGTVTLVNINNKYGKDLICNCKVENLKHAFA